MRNLERAKEWLKRAKSNLARAKAGKVSEDILYEDLCFDAQQAAEKALKALCIVHGVKFSRVHDKLGSQRKGAESIENTCRMSLQSELFSGHSNQTHPSFSKHVVKVFPFHVVGVGYTCYSTYQAHKEK